MMKKFYKPLLPVAATTCLAIASQTAFAKDVDIRDYFVGTYEVDGFNTTEVESYHAKANIKVNKGHFLRIEIDNENLGTYYGYFSKVDENTLKLDYKNLGGHEFTALCDYENDANNYPKFICQGDLQGTVGFDGVFVIHKTWNSLQNN